MIFFAVAVALALIAAVHWYLWKRLVADVSRPGGWWRRLGTVLAVLLALLVPATLVGARALSPTGAGRVLAWPGYLWVALLLYLVLAVAVLEIPRAVGRRWTRVRSGAERPPVEPTGGAGRQTAVPAPARPSAPVPDDAWRPGGSWETVAPGPDVDAGDDPTAGGQAGDDGGRADDGGQGDDRTDKGPADSPSDTGTQIDPARRLFLARSLALVAGAAAAGTVGYGLWSQLSGPVIKHVTIPLGRLDPQIDGFRIAVLSDLHLGPILDRGYTERVVDAVNSHSPDLVTLVGDLVDGSVDELGPAVEPLRRLAAPHGAYFVTGNHEYYSGVTEWVDEIRELGVHPLRNEHTEIIGGRTAAFDLAGVNDATGGEYSPGEAPNYAAALRGRDPDQAVVLLAHQPVQVHDAARRGVDLQLSGHTHGGQLWPFHYAVRLQQPVVSGLARFDRTWLYVTSGVGSWGPPVRVGARPDITIVTLRSTR